MPDEQTGSPGTPGEEDSRRTGIGRRKFLSSSLTAGMLGMGLSSVSIADGANGREGDTLVSTTELSEDEVDQLVQSVTTDEFGQTVESAEYLGVDQQIAEFADELQGFPTESDSHVVLSSGVAGDAAGDPGTFASTNVNGRQIPNYSPDNYDAYDVAELRIDFTIPDDAEGIAFDWRFASEENPSYLDSEFQDFFEALLFLSDGTVRNVGTLPEGEAATVDNANAYANSPGGDSQNPEPPLPDPADTVYNSVTELQTAKHAVGAYGGTEARLVVRIADASDGIYDSAVFVDNLRYSNDIESLPGPAEQALDLHRDAILDNVREAIRIEAETDAEIYTEHGAAYADNFVDYLGYAAGELPPSEVDEDLREVIDESTALPDAESMQSVYEFYDELYSKAANLTAEERPAVFEQYLLGTHPDQENHLLYNGQTIAEALNRYENETFPEFKEEFLQELEDGDYSAQEIQQIVSFLDQQTAYLDSKLGDHGRATDNTLDVFLGDDAVTGDGIGVQVETVDSDGDGENGSEGVSPQAIGTSAVIAGLILVKKAAAAGIIAKGGIGVAIKSTGAAKTISSVVAGSKVGAAAKGLLATKPGAVAAKAGHSFAHFAAPKLPPSSTVLSWSTFKWGAGELVSSQVLERILPVPLTVNGVTSAIVDYPFEAVLDDEDFSESSGMPGMCLERQARDAEITDLTVQNLNLTDIIDEFDIGNLPENVHYENGEFYGIGEGSITVENTGESPFTPSPQLTIHANDVTPAGQDTETGYPVVITDPLAEVQSGEQVTFAVEYAVPLGVFTSSYELRGDLTWADSEVSGEFEAGHFAFDFPSFDVLSGSLSDGEQIEDVHEPQQGTKTATYEMEYDQQNVDLHLFDENGNHVGKNYETNDFENEIPGATHSGHDSGGIGKEWASVEDVQSSAYTVRCVSPEIGTIIQSASEATTETQESVVVHGTATAENGSVDSAFDVEATEVPELEATAALQAPPTTASAGETVSIETSIREVSESDPLQNVQFEPPTLTTEETSESVAAESVTVGAEGFDLSPGGSRQVTVEVDLPAELEPATYRGELSATANDGGATNTVTIAVAVLPEPPSEAIGGAPEPPADLDGDGLVEDVDGDGTATVADAVHLFNHLDADAVQNNPKAFNFALDDAAEEVTVRDVQALYNRVTEGN